MSNWERKKLGDVCDIINGRNQKEVVNPQGAYPICGSGGVMGYADKYLCRENTVIIGRKGSINNPIYVQEKFWNVDTAFGLQSKDNYLPKLLYYFCIGYDFSKHNKGTTIPSVVKSDLLEIPIPVPPLAEQKRIVKTLDEKFAKIDKLKTAAETNLKNASEIFNAELNSKLNVENENLPQGWERKKICEVCDVTSSKRIFKDEYVENGIPFYRTKEIKELAHGLPISLELFISRDKYNSIKKKYGVPQIGDVLISAVGTIGEVLVIENDNPFYFKDGNIVWLKNIKSLDPFYLKYKLISITENLKAMTRGAAYNALTIEKLEVCSIPLPPLSEQKRIVAHLDKLSEKVKRLEEIYHRTIADCEELKKSILKQTFQGGN